MKIILSKKAKKKIVSMFLVASVLTLSGCGSKGGQDALRGLGKMGSGVKDIAVGIGHSFRTGGKEIAKGFKEAEAENYPAVKAVQPDANTPIIKAEKEAVKYIVPEPKLPSKTEPSVKQATFTIA